MNLNYVFLGKMTHNNEQFDFSYLIVTFK